MEAYSRHASGQLQKQGKAQEDLTVFGALLLWKERKGDGHGRECVEQEAQTVEDEDAY
jgi:hypothetical protein